MLLGNMTLYCLSFMRDFRHQMIKTDDAAGNLMAAIGTAWHN